MRARCLLVSLFILTFILERAGIVKRVSDAKRDRVYCANALLKILDEPANLRVTAGEK